MTLSKTTTLDPAMDHETTPKSVPALAQHRATILLLGIFWLLFLLFDFSGDFFRALHRGFAVEALTTGLPQLAFVYFAWFCVSTAIGLWAHRWPVSPSLGIKHWLIHGAIAVSVALFHLAWITLSYWIFVPRLVVNSHFIPVFSEQFFKWFHFELVIYALILGIWTLVFSRKSKPPQEFLARLMVKDDDVQKVVAVVDIEWLEADDNYVLIHTKHEHFVKRASLKQLEHQLSPKDFVRVNRGAVVNARHVSKVRDANIHLNTGAVIPISRRRKTSVLRCLGHQSPSKNDR